MPDAWSDKEERQYEHIKESARKRGKSLARAKEIAARTVNKQRREEGKTPQKTSQGTGNPHKKLIDRTKQELYNRARQLNVAGRSKMSKSELVDAIREKSLPSEIDKVWFTKADFIRSVARNTDLPKHKSSQAVEHLIEIMKGTLASGEDVLTSGFGKVCVNEKSERRGRNPAIGFMSKQFNPRFLTVALGFSAGVMIYVSMIEIFVKASAPFLIIFAIQLDCEKRVLIF